MPENSEESTTGYCTKTIFSSGMSLRLSASEIIVAGFASVVEKRMFSAATWARQLYVLYVYAADHGTDAGPALLEAVLDPEESAALWVADPNPRAQAFYRKHGFVADGTAQVEDGVREIRMVRGMQHSR